MKKLFYVFMLLILVSCGSDRTANISSDTSIGTSSVKITSQSILSQMDKAKYVEGELLVKFKSGVTSTASLRLHQTFGASTLKRFTLVNNLEHVKLSKGVSVKDAIIKYMSDTDVEYAEPNYIKRTLSRIPNDTYFGDQWALNNTGTYAGGTPDADIDAPEAWDITTGNSDIIIAVLDTGIDYNHPDLVGNIWTNTGETNCTNGIDDDNNGFIDDCKGWDFTTCAKFDDVGNCVTTKSTDNDPMDDNGHGTHVGGIIGAVGNNNTGVSGVMWNVKLMAVKFLDADGEGTTADEIAAIDYVVMMKNTKGFDIKAINASFGGYGFSAAEQDALTSANAAGVLVIAAAGNGGADEVGDNNDFTPLYPASYNLPNIISVAATDQNDMRVSFSNYGLTSVHVAAPGVYIISTVPTWWSEYPGYGILEFFAGTSMATPHVSGLAGLLYSYYDGVHNTLFNYSQIRSTILRYVDVLPTLNGWIQTGGRINAFSALSSLLTPTNLTATAISPTQISLTWSDNANGEDGYKIERKIGDGAFTELSASPLPANSISFTDTSLTPNTTYTYRIRAFNNIAESFNSNDTSAITPAGENGGGEGGGGGGCSIGTRQNTTTAVADFAVMLIPLIFIAIMRRRK